MIQINRFDYFLVWGHGLKYIDEILSHIRLKNFKIIKIIKKEVPDLKNFVLDLYSCDPAPAHHIRNKIKYLFEVPNQIIIILVKNINVDVNYVRKNKDSTIQCNNVNAVKIFLRNKYNPKHEDRNFIIKPLNKGVSHNHIVHSSDNEHQVDFILKLIGYDNGIKFFSRYENLPFFVPYYIDIPKKILFKRLPISKLRANILLIDKSKTNKNLKEIRKLKNTPHYKGLLDNFVSYENYLNEFKFTRLTSDYSIENFKNLKNMDKIKYQPIIVRKQSSNYLILDGLHRAAIILHSNLKYAKCAVC